MILTIISINKLAHDFKSPFLDTEITIFNKHCYFSKDWREGQWESGGEKSDLCTVFPLHNAHTEAELSWNFQTKKVFSVFAVCMHT